MEHNFEVYSILIWYFLMYEYHIYIWLTLLNGSDFIFLKYM